MWCGGEFFCGVGLPANVVTRIKCGDPCINFGVAISSREETPPPPNTPPGVATSPLGKGTDGMFALFSGVRCTGFCCLYKAMMSLLSAVGGVGGLGLISNVQRRSILFFSSFFLR